MTMHQRRDQRSAAAPNTGPSSIAGSRSASKTSVIAHGRVPAVVGDQEQRDVTRAVPKGGLRERTEEPASTPLGSEEVDQLAHCSPSLEVPDPALEGETAPICGL